MGVVSMSFMIFQCHDLVYHICLTVVVAVEVTEVMIFPDSFYHCYYYECYYCYLMGICYGSCFHQDILHEWYCCYIQVGLVEHHFCTFIVDIVDCVEDLEFNILVDYHSEEHNPYYHNMVIVTYIFVMDIAASIDIDIYFESSYQEDISCDVIDMGLEVRDMAHFMHIFVYIYYIMTNMKVLYDCFYHFIPHFWYFNITIFLSYFYLIFFHIHYHFLKLTLYFNILVCLLVFCYFIFIFISQNFKILINNFSFFVFSNFFFPISIFIVFIHPMIFHHFLFFPEILSQYDW